MLPPWLTQSLTATCTFVEQAPGTCWRSTHPEFPDYAGSCSITLLGLEDFEKSIFQTVFEFRSAMAQARETIRWTCIFEQDSAFRGLRQYFGTLRLKRDARSI